nr:FUSC family protein [Flexivirga meconopsidis]
MVPFVGGRYAAERPPRGPRRPIVATVHGHVRSGSPEFRYAAQAAICCAVAYVVLKLLDWPHESWAIVGILTTLRPTWEATHARVVKRSVGMVGGAVLTAVMLAVVAQTSVWVGIVTIAVFGGLARPLRQFNYGYWPIFGTPVLLLLVSVTDHFHTIDAVYRLGNNLLGAAVTLAAVNLLWPHRVQHPRGGFRQERSA